MLAGVCEVWSPPAETNNSLGAGSRSWGEPGEQEGGWKHRGRLGSGFGECGLGTPSYLAWYKTQRKSQVKIPPSTAANRDIIVSISFVVE